MDEGNTAWFDSPSAAQGGAGSKRQRTVVFDSDEFFEKVPTEPQKSFGATHM